MAISAPQLVVLTLSTGANPEYPANSFFSAAARALPRTGVGDPVPAASEGCTLEKQQIETKGKPPTCGGWSVKICMRGVAMAVQASLAQSTLGFISACDITFQVAHSLLWSLLCVGFWRRVKMLLFSFFCVGDSDLQSAEFYLGFTSASE